MALADTARLIASLELQDRFSGPARGIDRSLGGLERRVGTLGRIGGEVGRGVGAAVSNLQRIGVVAGGIIAANVAAGLQSIVRLEQVETQTAAVLASTRSIAGITATEVRDLAEAYEGLNATIDDKVIQSGANLLLTFTNIREDAFEPALQAALDMNQAMGGGEEGLQNTIIQVGKALQDPIRGITALRRVGVNFTDAQKEQIRALVEANDLYGAQQVVLAELATEFGGSFAAAGDTAAGKFAKVKDAVEDAQMALATAFLPVLVKVSDKLQTFLADPAVLTRIQEFGSTLAEGLDDAIEFAGHIPWEAIGTSLEIAGRGARVIFDSFNALPPWVQTAVITGWGLNKLTGGALGNIVGALGSGLIKGVLGMNAGVVNINAGVVNGGGGVPVGPVGPTAASPVRTILGNITKFLGLATGVGFATLLGTEVGKSVASLIGVPSAEEVTAPAIEFETDELVRVIEDNNPASLQSGIDSIDDGIRDLVLAGQTTTPFGVGFGLLFRDQLQVLIDQRAALQRQLDAIKVIDESIGAAARSDHADTLDVTARLAAIETSIGTAAQSDRTDAATATARLTAIDSSIGSAAQSDHADAAAQRAALAAAKERIAAVMAAVGAAQTAKAETVAAAVRTNTAVLGAKNFAPDIAVTTNVTSNVSITDVTRRLVSSSIAQSVATGGGGFAV